MEKFDRFDFDTQARDLRRQEIARLLAEFACAMRRVLARAGVDRLGACSPHNSLAT